VITLLCPVLRNNRLFSFSKINTCDDKEMQYLIGREIKVDFVLVPFKRAYHDTSIKMSATALFCDTLEDSRQNKRQ
jgi:hypothetical protein